MIGRKGRGAFAGLVAVMLAGLALAAPAKDVRWSLARAKAWGDAQPWYRPSMLPYKGEWQVDLFRGDFTPYRACEIELLKKTISSKTKRR